MNIIPEEPVIIVERSKCLLALFIRNGIMRLFFDCWCPLMVKNETQKVLSPGNNSSKLTQI